MQGTSRPHAAEALAAAEALGYPVVLKAVGPLHKSDVGGVAVGIGGPEELEAALSRMSAVASEGFSVERMAPVEEGIELIVGARRDARFGPVLLVGVGGLYAEVLADVAVALAPVSADEAEGLIRSLRAAPLLRGRGDGGRSTSRRLLGRRPRSHTWRRRGRTCKRSRSTRCSSRRRAPSGSTPASCSARKRGEDETLEVLDQVLAREQQASVGDHPGAEASLHRRDERCVFETDLVANSMIPRTVSSSTPSAK